MGVIQINKKRFLLSFILAVIFIVTGFFQDNLLNYNGDRINYSVAYAKGTSRSSSGGFKSGSFKSSSTPKVSSPSTSSKSSSKPSGWSSKSSTSKSSSGGFKSGSFSKTPGSNKTESNSSQYDNKKSSGNYDSQKKSWVPIPIPWSFGRSRSYGSYSSPFGVVGSLFRTIIIIIIVIIIIKMIKKYMNRR